MSTRSRPCNRTWPKRHNRSAVPREKRGFTPHVTLGRVKSPFGALALLDALRAASKTLNTKPFTPTALVLYRSTLTPGGPLHEPLLHRVLAHSHP